MSVQKLHFTYESPENLVRLLVNIQFENRYNPRDVTIYHSRFDKEPDDFYRNCMEKLYPNGCTIGKDELDKITEYVYDFMQKDEETLKLYVNYDKRRIKSYVYCKPFFEVQGAGVGSHAALVEQFCVRFFKGFNIEDITLEKIRKFIKNNIEIKSDYTSMKTICAEGNLKNIFDGIVFYNKLANS